jgi:hypothetical protein
VKVDDKNPDLPSIGDKARALVDQPNMLERLADMIRDEQRERDSEETDEETFPWYIRMTRRPGR